MSELRRPIDAEHAAFDRVVERYAELRADVAEAFYVGAAAMLAGPPRPSFVVTDTGLILHSEEFAALERRMPGYWALQNPRPFGEPPRRGGLSRCRTLAHVLGAAMVIA